jgi:hypothetical protein
MGIGKGWFKRNLIINSAYTVLEIVIKNYRISFNTNFLKRLIPLNYSNFPNVYFSDFSSDGVEGSPHPTFGGC